MMYCNYVNDVTHSVVTLFTLSNSKVIQKRLSCNHASIVQRSKIRKAETSKSIVRPTQEAHTGAIPLEELTLLATAA